MMAASTVDGIFGIAILSGVALCWIGYASFRRWDEPGVTSFAVYVGILGLCGILSGTVAIAYPVDRFPSGFPPWFVVGYLCMTLLSIPWILFALRYTGRATSSTVRIVGLLGAPVLLSLPVLTNVAIREMQVGVLPGLVTFLITLYVFALFGVGSYLLIRTTWTYGHLSVLQGLLLAVTGILLIVGVQFSGPLAARQGETAGVALYTTGFAISVLTLCVAIRRYGMFDSTPAIGVLGERAITRETDDLIFVTDVDGRLIKHNEAVAETLPIGMNDPHGMSLADIVGQTIDGLRANATVVVQTTAGNRRFDSQVSTVTDHRDDRLGYVVSLRDVTERELRKQRLEVFNRILRHNLRNQLTVITGNAEILAERTETEGEETVTAILESAERLGNLGETARSMDQFITRNAEITSVDLTQSINDTLVGIKSGDTDLEVRTRVPETAPVVTDQDALVAVLEGVFENALRHAETTVTVTIEPTSEEEYTLLVSDDGPGIPDEELEPLDAGTETPLHHASGLTLWQLEWGVTKLNGELSFDTENGTTVRITIPDQRPTTQPSPPA